MKVNIDLDLEMYEALSKACKKAWVECSKALDAYCKDETEENRATARNASYHISNLCKLKAEVTKYVYLLGREANGQEVTEEEIKRVEKRV